MEKTALLGVEAKCASDWSGFHVFNVLLISGLVIYALLSIWYALARSKKSNAYRATQVILSLVIVLPLSFGLAIYIRILTC